MAARTCTRVLTAALPGPDAVYWDIGPVNALVIDPGNRANLYVGTPEGVFQSADGGASWSNIGLSMGVTSLALDPGDSNTIYAGSGNYSSVSRPFQEHGRRRKLGADQ